MCSNSSKSPGTTSSPSLRASESPASAPSSRRLFRPYPGPLALYLHFPFCTNLCRYCDFYKEPFDIRQVERYFRAVTRETEAVLSAFEQEPLEIASIYIGGGTPSLVDTGLLDQWVALVDSYATFQPGFEFTIEANPESLTDAFARRTVAAGVNRIVIGVQSFQVGALRTLGRRQKTRDIYRAFYNARLAGYTNIGADLIFGLPGETMRKMRLDIERLTALEPTHLSFYQLTVEPGTPLERDILNEKVRLPNEEKLAEMYRLGVHMLIDRGYLRYEVSNFAPDQYRCRHNQTYWSGAPYIGLGPAAHGFINGHRYANVADVGRYIEMTEAGVLPLEFTETSDPAQRLTETVMLSLRTAAGIDKENLLRTFGEPALAVLEGATAASYINAGFLLNEAGRLCLTDAGFLLADKIIADLLP